MLVLFDQSTPVGLRSYLVGHRVETAAQRGWDTLKNGDLLQVAEDAGFEVWSHRTKICVTNRISRTAGLRLW
jgi:hypothetical protein